MSLSDIIPDSDYRFHLRLEPIRLDAFFGPSAEHERLLRERRHWLAVAPHTYAALLPEGAALLSEALDLLQPPPLGAGVAADPGQTDWDRCLDLGRHIEPDFLLLAGGPDSEIRLCGGCVCFPSSWSLAEKVSQPMELIHAPVPGLNAQIGPQIRSFLNKLRPGLVWSRTNWGLSRSSELNQHPERRLPRIDQSAGADEIWFRVEHQALAALPATGGILFGIRISTHPLAAVKADSIASQRLGRALRTMPAAVARYKGLETGRARILDFLES